MNSPFLLSIVEQMRMQRYAKRTIESYVYWIKAFIFFNDKKHPRVCHDMEVELFLSYLANERLVSPNTQSLALNALVFLYRDVLFTPLTLTLKFNKTSTQVKLPIVLTVEEITLLLKNIPTNLSLPCKLLYGSGLRLMEAVRLRVQDIDFDHLSLRIWHGKGGKNRQVTLAKELLGPLRDQIAQAKCYFKALL